MAVKWIVALDPGVTTGVAAMPFDDVAGVVYADGVEVAQLACGLVPVGMRRIVEVCEGYGLVDGAGGILVAEEFILRGGSNSSDPAAVWPLRLLGALEDRCYDWVCLYATQTPSQKGVMTDERLKLRGLWRTKRDGGGPHAMDAMRHLVVYALSHGLVFAQ